MEPLERVTFIQGDFREAAVLDELLGVLAGRPVDLVISDLAPNKSGIKAVDQPQSLYLAELAVDFARQCLRPGGDLLVKAFQGEGFDALLRELRQQFARVLIRKPQASRARSNELYLLARNYQVKKGL
jgi:23S rRNA (uridine2552-2'-O)-methyltransferase